MKIDNSENPKVCVVMPVYNGAKTIELALKSLLYQTYDNWTCVIVNDGSTDSTKDILDNIKDNRFKIIQLERNRGRGYARQVCLENASGDYLAFLDADDFYHPNKIQKQVEIFISNSDIDLVSCGQGSYNEQFKLMIVRGDNNYGKYNFNIGMEAKFTCAASIIKLKSATNFKYNGVLNASEDIDFFSRYLDNKTYFLINDILYYYSEFESFTYLKTIKYNFYKLLRIFFLFKNDKSKSIIQILKTIFKTLIYIVLIPFLGKEFFITKRGRKPTKEQINEFNNHLLTLLKSRQ